jgi:trk system potassium uptake protein TrkA
MKTRVIIVGGGRIGAHLASLLIADGIRVKLVEVSTERIPSLQHMLASDAVVLGSGTDLDVLEAAGVRDADVLAAVTGIDEVNLVVTSLARFEFQVPRTIARVKDPDNAWMFTAEMGVDAAVNQADLMAHLIAEEISVGEVLTLLKLHKGEYSLVEQKVHPQAPASGKAISTLIFPSECVVAAVIRAGQLIIPHGYTVLQADDEVLAVVHAAHLQELSALLGHSGQG